MSEEQASQDNTEDVKDQTSNESEQESGAEKKSTEEVLYGDDKSKEKESSEEQKEDEEKSDDESDKESEEKSDDEKKADEDSKDDVEYKLKSPENSRLGDADMERIASFAKEQGLSKEAAQKLVDQESEAREAFFNDLQSQHKEMVQQWVSDIKGDKEIGGDNFNKSVELAKRAVDKFGTDKFKEDLDKSGYGNHPEVVRTFSRIGRFMASDELVRPGNQAGGDRSMEDIFYGNQN